MNNCNFTDTISNIYHSQQSRHAVKTGLAAILAVIVYQFFNLPHGYWAVITAVIIMQSNMDTGSFEATLKFAFQRLIGTVLGAIVGFTVFLLLAPNYWQLLIAVFILILLGSYITKLYSGLSLSGPTAVIILLLAHQGPITQSFAFMRTLEILLGVVIAILVTICIWPYRITDHLKKNRQKYLRLISHQFSKFTLLSNHKLMTDEWHKKQKDLVTLVKSEQKYVNMAKKELRDQEQENLNLLLQLVKFLNQLGEAFPQLPKAYWQFASLKSSTLSLINSLTTILENLASKKPSVEVSKLIKAEANTHLNAFKKFRSAHKQSNIPGFDIEAIYQTFTTFQLLQQCSEVTEELISKELRS